MSEFGLVKSFQIDNGELNGINPQNCFVLGYELAQIDRLLKEPSEIQRPVHADNKIRIKSACEDSNRPYKLTWLTSDISESWMWLEVKGLELERKDNEP